METNGFDVEMSYGMDTQIGEMLFGLNATHMLQYEIPVGGVIKEILVKAGDKVSVGQILIVLDKEISLQNLKSLEDQLSQKNIQLELKKEEKK